MLPLCVVRRLPWMLGLCMQLGLRMCLGLRIRLGLCIHLGLRGVIIRQFVRAFEDKDYPLSSKKENKIFKKSLPQY